MLLVANDEDDVGLLLDVLTIEIEHIVGGQRRYKARDVGMRVFTISCHTVRRHEGGQLAERGIVVVDIIKNLLFGSGNTLFVDRHLSDE